MWNDWYQFNSERSEAIKEATEKYENKVKREDREWFVKMQGMDRVMRHESMRRRESTSQ